MIYVSVYFVRAVLCETYETEQTEYLQIKIDQITNAVRN